VMRGIKTLSGSPRLALSVKSRGSPRLLQRKQADSFESACYVSSRECGMKS